MSWKNDQVSPVETAKIIEMARECLERPGDFVEFGCYKGDTSLALAEILNVKNREKTDKFTFKKLWLYDSFEGLPEKGAEDFSELGRDFRGGELLATKREVKERFLRANLPVPAIKKGWFSELTSEDLPEKIALALIDGDFYNSTKEALALVEPHLTEEAVILVHDYNNPALPGVEKAVNEWLQGRNYQKEVCQSLSILRRKI